MVAAGNRIRVGVEKSSASRGDEERTENVSTPGKRERKRFLKKTPRCNSLRVNHAFRPTNIHPDKKNRPPQIETGDAEGGIAPTALGDKLPGVGSAKRQARHDDKPALGALPQVSQENPKAGACTVNCH